MRRLDFPPVLLWRRPRKLLFSIVGDATNGQGIAYIGLFNVQSGRCRGGAAAPIATTVFKARIFAVNKRIFKMVRALSIILALAYGFSAAAESAKFMDGVWFGKGTFQMGDQIFVCSDIMMTFSGDEKTFVVREATMKCDGMDPQTFTEVDTFTLDANGDLTFQKGVATQIAPGTKVGKVNGNRLMMLNPIVDAKVDDIDMRLSGDILVYSQIAGAVGVQPDYALLALLKKK